MPSEKVLPELDTPVEPVVSAADSDVLNQINEENVAPIDPSAPAPLPDSAPDQRPMQDPKDVAISPKREPGTLPETVVVQDADLRGIFETHGRKAIKEAGVALGQVLLSMLESVQKEIAADVTATLGSRGVTQLDNVLPEVMVGILRDVKRSAVPEVIKVLITHVKGGGTSTLSLRDLSSGPSKFLQIQKDAPQDERAPATDMENGDPATMDQNSDPETDSEDFYAMPEASVLAMGALALGSVGLDDLLAGSDLDDATTALVEAAVDEMAKVNAEKEVEPDSIDNLIDLVSASAEDTSVELYQSIDELDLGL